MSDKSRLPAFPYGAVYFRKSNPPKEDWERDYGVASEDGMNIFRHWFLWSAIEVEPGVYDWEDYDRQMDLAAQNGIKTIIAEMITAAPEWAYVEFADARHETNTGQKVESSMGGSCNTGGFPGLSLNHAGFRAAAERFLRALVTRYKDHPGMGGYDVWNECNYRPNHGYDPATLDAFREWLKAKYGDLKTLGNTWHRHSFAKWEYVTPPRNLGPYQDTLDWLEFRTDNAYEQMRWRVNLIREIDTKSPITAHGIAATFKLAASGGSDDWLAAAEVESYGYTWGSSRHGDESWKQMQAVDLVRASSRGKPFWHAETYAGPLWMQHNVIGKPRDEGRIASVEDIRYWDMVSFMCGATGMLYLRWRPLLNGPLFGAFGGYGMDGSRTERSDMVSKVAKWVNADAQKDLWQSRPIKGEVGIVYAPETQRFIYAQQKEATFYTRSMEGAYQGFFDNNVQADWVHINNISEYDTLYLPIPVMLNESTVNALKDWVKAGGTLISEGCPAYFGEQGFVGTTQPNYGLDEVFGARESYVEFTPDLLGDLQFSVNGKTVRGGIFLQAYEPTTGTTVGTYENGLIAAVDNTYGQGKTRLVGSMVGSGHDAHPENGCASFFADVLAYAGKEQHVKVSDKRVKARLHDGDGGTYLWVANASRQDIPVTVTLGTAWQKFNATQSLAGASASIDGGVVTLVAPARDVTVIRLS